MIHVLLSIMPSPNKPIICKDVAVCIDILAPVEIPVTYSRNLLRKELPDLMNVLNATFYGPRFLPSRSLNYPSNIQLFASSSLSFLLFNIENSF